MSRYNNPRIAAYERLQAQSKRARTSGPMMLRTPHGRVRVADGERILSLLNRSSPYAKILRLAQEEMESGLLGRVDAKRLRAAVEERAAEIAELE